MTSHGSVSPCLWKRVVVPARRTVRFVIVFLLLLCAAESLLSLAVYLGYTGGTYLQRVNWYKDGTLTFAEFRSELISSRSVGYRGDDADGGRVAERQTSVDSEKLPPCPPVPPGLSGPLKADMNSPPSFRQLEASFSHLGMGGRYRPPDCNPQQRLAIIVPYRDRRVHLKIFLRNIHPFLQKQQLNYGIFVIELKEGIAFNRALLFNIGFQEALKVDNYTCFIFHDVDLLPENDRNLYRCCEVPRHMSVAVDRMKYKLPYSTIFGGVTALSRQHFLTVNGFSNQYFGWGGEDDDMFKRIRSRGLTVVRYPGNVARYKAMAHAKAERNPSRLKLLHQGPQRFLTDGLNSLQYTRLDFKLNRLYTWVFVKVDREAITASADSKPSKTAMNKQTS